MSGLLKRFPAIDRAVDRIGYWLSFFGSVWAAMTWLINQTGALSGYGWSGLILAGIAATAALILVASAFLVAWRYFHPLTPPNETAPEQGPAADETLQRVENINKTMVNLFRENDANLAKLKEQIRTTVSQLEKQISSVSERGHALRAVYEMNLYKRDIERLIILLDRPIKCAEGLRDWTGWDKRFKKFSGALANYLYIASVFFPNEVPNIKIIPPETYRRDTGDFARELFPDHQTAHDFKTFRYLSSIYESVGADLLTMTQSKIYG